MENVSVNKKIIEESEVIRLVSSSSSIKGAWFLHGPLQSHDYPQFNCKCHDLQNHS